MSITQNNKEVRIISGKNILSSLKNELVRKYKFGEISDNTLLNHLIDFIREYILSFNLLRNEKHKIDFLNKEEKKRLRKFFVELRDLLLQIKEKLNCDLKEELNLEAIYFSLIEYFLIKRWKYKK